MKYTSAVLALAAATATARAQDISIFPECSMPCIIDAVGKTSCELTDFACVCKNIDSIKQGATSCVVDKCGIDVALNEVLPATEQFCADVGNGDGDGDGDDGEGEGDGGSESSSAPAPPATSTTTTLVTSTTKAPEEPSPSATETPGGGGDEDEDDGGDGEDDGDDDDEPTGTTSSPGSIITPEPTGSAIPSGGDEEDTPPATSSIATAGAAVVGAMGSLGMMLLGAVAAL
ncbi:uncharacterized protein P884DRAFT_301861 [Thermothelomyces heterothallicus CBS 202.75]|uniref:uncharacterized protein n=1 Tax=Thermothelomyces heterothallicus CBS 202.75 TaxID=1149848 RepID=UPI003742AC12